MTKIAQTIKYFFKKERQCFHQCSSHILVRITQKWKVVQSWGIFGVTGWNVAFLKPPYE